MEFYSRKDLPQPPFEIARTDAELWDLVTSARLVPFVKAPLSLYNPPDPISGDYRYVPLFPYPFDQDYARLRVVSEKIRILTEDLETYPTDETWLEYFKSERRRLEGKAPESWLKVFEPSRKEAVQELAELRSESERLEAKFADIAGLYAGWDFTSGQHEFFLRQLNDAYYRRDHIESAKVLSRGRQATNPSENRKGSGSDKDSVRAYAKGVIECEPKITRTALADRIQKSIPEAQNYTTDTLIERTRNLFPDYTPLKPGRKPKK